MDRLMNEVTNDRNHSRSPSIDNQSTSGDEYCVPKRKPRRVRSLIKYSIDQIMHDNQLKQLDQATIPRPNANISTGEKRPFPFGQCRVCMDKATGAHYGVPTCEGCKGFFKRSILRKEKYRCYFGDRCIITTDNRNRCKSCRFQKCLNEGMSIDGVRMGRIPKSVKEKALAECHLSSSSTENDDPSVSLSPLIHSGQLISSNFDLQLINEQVFFDQLNSSEKLPSCTSYILPANFTIDETIQDEEENFIHYEEQFSNQVIERIENFVRKMTPIIINSELDYEELAFIRYVRWKMIDLSNIYNERTRQLIERMKTMIHLQIKNYPGDQSSLQDVLAGLADAIPFHVKNLITFAQQTPAINEIDLKDFHTIMNNRLFDFWLIKHAPLICNNESYMLLPNGLQYTRQWMIKVLGDEMVDAMFDFATKFNALNLKFEEHALVLPVVICLNDETLRDQETVRNIQSCYLYALYSQMLTTRTPSEARTVFRNLLEIFDLLPVLNELQKEKIGTLIPDRMESE